MGTDTLSELCYKYLVVLHFFKMVVNLHIDYIEFICTEKVEDYHGYLAQLCKRHQCFLLDKLRPKQLFSAFLLRAQNNQRRKLSTSLQL